MHQLEKLNQYCFHQTQKLNKLQKDFEDISQQNKTGREVIKQLLIDKAKKEKVCWNLILCWLIEAIYCWYFVLVVYYWWLYNIIKPIYVFFKIVLKNIKSIKKQCEIEHKECIMSRELLDHVAFTSFHIEILSFKTFLNN